jgi:uncharacterized membrane protein YdfJ with MMPL/SSD domain
LRSAGEPPGVSLVLSVEPAHHGGARATVDPVLEALASTAWNRSRELLAGALALLVLLAALAALTLGSLGGGSDRVDAAAGPDLVLKTEAGKALPSNAHDVALQTIAARVKADPAVESVRTVDRPKSDSKAVLEISLAGDGGDKRVAAERVVEEVDPGPLRMSSAGEVFVTLDAGSNLQDDLWRLELLALPLALLALIAVFGARLAPAPVLTAATGAAGALAGLGVGGLFFDAAALAAVPGVALGLALAVELSALLMSRLEDESQLESGVDALRNALRDGAVPIGYAAAVGAAASAGLLVTGLDAAGSILLACTAGAAFALLSALLAVPPLFAIELRARAGADAARADAGEGRRLARWLAAPPRLLARGSLRTSVVAIVALCGLVALAIPLLGATSAPLAARDAAGDSLIGQLPLAGVAAAVLLAAGFALRAQDLRAAILGPLSLLPAAAAVGVVAAVFQDGTALPSPLGDPHQLSNAAVANLAAIVGGIGAARTLAASEAVRSERELDPGRAGVAERSAALSLPAALVGTLVAGAGGAVLVGADLRAAQELGLGIAAGLLADAVLARTPMVAALARWGGGKRIRFGASVAWPTSWKPRVPRRRSTAGSAS